MTPTLASARASAASASAYRPSRASSENTARMAGVPNRSRNRWLSMGVLGMDGLLIIWVVGERWPWRSLGLDAGVRQHAAPALLLGHEEVARPLRRRRRHGNVAELGEARDEGRVCERGARLVVEPPRDRLRRAG